MQSSKSVTSTLFRFGLILMILKTVLSFSAIFPWPDTADNIVVVVASICFLTAIIIRKYPLRMFVGFALIIVIALYGAVITKNTIILSTVLICIASYKENFNEAVNTIFHISRFCFVFHTLSALVVHFVYGTEIVRIIGGKTRYTFGFGHPNTFSCYFFNLILMWIWLNFYQLQKSKVSLIVVSLLTFIVFSFTKTKTMLGVSLVVYLLWFLSRGINKERKWLSVLARMITPICSILILALTIIYVVATDHGISNHFILMLRTLFTGRIHLGAYALSRWGVTLFGQNIPQHSTVYDPVWKLNGYTFDDVYTYLSINMGIVWLIIIAVLFYRLAKKKNDKVNIFIIAWAIYGVCEVHVLDVFMFFPAMLVVLPVNEAALSNHVSNQIRKIRI